MLRVSRLLNADATYEVYHGSPEDFDEFDPARINPNDPEGPYNGYWFSSKKETAEGFAAHPWRRPDTPGGGITKKFNLNLENPASKAQAYAVAREIRPRLEELYPDKTLQEATRLELQKRGFDGVIHEEPKIITPTMRKQIEAGQQVNIGDGYAVGIDPDDGSVDLYYQGEHQCGFESIDDVQEQMNEGTYVAFHPHQMQKVSHQAAPYCTRAWIDPQGNVQVVPQDEEHYDLAERILAEEYYVDQVITLLQRGWTRIGVLSGHTYIMVWRLTREILHRLQTFVMTNSEFRRKTISIEQYDVVDNRNYNYHGETDEFLLYNSPQELWRQKVSSRHRSTNELTIPAGTKLYHGTSETIKGPLRAGIDGCLWFTTSPTMSRAYIPAAGSTMAVSMGLLMDPPQKGSSVEDFQEQFGISYSGVNYVDHRGVEQIRPQSYYAPKIINELSANLPPINEADYEDKNDFYGAKHKRSQEIRALFAKYIDGKLKALGYSPEEGYGTGERSIYKVKLTRNNGKENIAPNKNQAGTLIIVTPKTPLKIYDMTMGGALEGDLTDLDYHKVDDFARLAKEGFDGVKINDFAQVDKQGNMGHVAIGIFPRSTNKLEVLESQETTHPEDIYEDLRKHGSVLTSKGTSMKRSPLGVGKLIGGDLYIHKMYAGDLPDQEAYRNAVEKLPTYFNWNVVKVCKDGSYTFFNSTDFDTAPEPTAGEYMRVTLNGMVKPGRTTNLWHHKWLWVKDDYPGFDVEESKERSRQWLALSDVDSSRIGNPNHWNQKVLPRLQ